MNLTEILTEKEQQGTYAGVKFDNATKKAIREFTKQHNIPNVVPRDKLHTTVLYSRKHLPNYKPLGKFEDALEGEFKEFVIWKGQDEGLCLVMLFDCTELVQRHNQLMDEHKATFDYDEYRPHITLSYNVEKDFDVNALDAYSGPINIVEEYHEPLTLDWKDKE